MIDGKRAFDLTICLLLGWAALVVVGIAALVIAKESHGSPFFRQLRVGHRGKPFTILKLRTMHAATRDVASHQVDAVAITPLGKFLRRYKIDELPQLANVFLGQMSLVGPRPCLPSQHDVIRFREILGVMDLVPGITGPAQIAGIDMSEPERLAEADATYLTPWSLAADLRYLIRTVRGEGGGDAALVPK